MTRIRTFIARHRGLALWLAAVALLMKVMVPAGYMPSIGGGSVTITLCTGEGVKAVAVALPGAPAERSDGAKKQQQGTSPCAFTSLWSPASGAIDAALLAIAIAFIMAFGVRPVVQRIVATPAFLRPPLRGPPIAA